MTTGPALPCPRCKRVLGPESWHDEHSGRCFRCMMEFEFIPFPALHATRTAAAPQAAVLAADSVCFFHQENRAEAVCEDCGRMLCVVCAVPFAGRKLCPSCIAASKSSEASDLIRDRVLYDSTTLVVALLPILFWPVTLVSAPVALGMVIIGWKKPGSLVRGRSRARFIIAAIASVAQIAGWIAAGIYLSSK